MSESENQTYGAPLDQPLKMLDQDELQNMSGTELVQQVKVLQGLLVNNANLFSKAFEVGGLGFIRWYSGSEQALCSGLIGTLIGAATSEVDTSLIFNSVEPNKQEEFKDHIRNCSDRDEQCVITVPLKPNSTRIRYVTSKTFTLELPGGVTDKVSVWVDVTEKLITQLRLQEMISDLEMKVQGNLNNVAQPETAEEKNAGTRSAQELTLNVLSEKLESSIRLLEESKQEMEFFTYAVSHDLRAPLRAIEGFSRILLDKAGNKLAKEEQRYLNIIQDNVVKMSDLIDHILQLSRLGRIELRKYEFDMQEVLEEVLDTFKDDTPDHLQVQIKKPLPKLYGDRTMLTMALQNVIGNAIKFSSKKENPKVVIQAEEKDDHTIMQIQDNGAGFDMKYVHKVFLVFQRLHTSEEFTGTGVGLALVKRVVDRHEGTVSIASQPDKGTIVKLSFPKQR